MSKYKKLAFTILVTGGAFAINYLINFFLTPYVTENIGTDAYGFVTLARSFASYAMIITVALNSYASRFITIEYHRDNMRKANIYYNSVFFADLFLGSIIFAISIFFSMRIEVFFDIDSWLVDDVRILFVLMFLNLLINTSGTALQAAAYIKNKLDIVGIARNISYIIEALMLVCCYTFFPAKVFYVGIGTIAATMIITCSNFYITKKYTPELKIDKTLFAMSAVKKLVINGIWNSLNSLGNTLNNGLDLIVANVMLSAIAMGQISIIKTVFAIFSGVYQLIAQPFQPIFLKDYAVGNKQELLKNLKLSMKISGLIANLIFAGFFALGINYFRLWVPSQDPKLMYQLTLLATVTCILEGPIYPLYYIYTLTEKNRIPCFITIAGGVLNALGMYFLIKYTSLGIYSIQITTAVIMLFISGVTNPLYMAHCLGEKWFLFYPLLGRNVISCGAMMIAMRVISNVMDPVTWLSLILAALACVLIGSLIHLIIIFSSEEKDKFLKIIRQKV